MEKAVEWLSKAQEAMFNPNIITYNVLINACVKSGDIETAVEWLSKVQEAGFRPNITTYNVVFDACATDVHLLRQLGVFLEVVITSSPLIQCRCG